LSNIWPQISPPDLSQSDLYQGDVVEQAIATFVVINFLIIGFSHLVQPKLWMGFFGILHAQGNAGVFANGFLTLLTGSLIVAFHNVWSGLPIVLTLIGWAFVAKSALILVFPEIGLMSLARSQTMPLMKFRIAGAGLIAVATMLVYAIMSGAYEPAG
jgi:hypothetical protein